MKKIKVFLRIWTFLLALLCLVPSAYSATVDVMIVFDSTAKTWVDSNGGMNTFAAEVIAKLNQSTANSGVNLTFRLAHATVISYTHNGNLETDLDRLRRTGDGYMDNVHILRNTYGVDLVTMLVDTGSVSGSVGMGYELTSSLGDPAYAFTVSAIQSADISHTLTHEVGHNFGCGHSKYQKDSQGPGLYSYSAGWYFEGTDAMDYGTIMAYNKDGYGNTYIETPYFSNPDIRYEGGITGHAVDGDNARTIENMMNVVAGYRAEVVIDKIPDLFSFKDQTNVARNILVTSNTITVSGINVAVNISIAGGKYAINGGSYTDSDGQVNNGDKITVQLTSSGSYLTEVSATLVMGGESDTFNVKTRSAIIPDQFTFVDQISVSLNTTLISNVIMVSGIVLPAPISITGGTYSVNGGPYTNESGTVEDGDTVSVQQMSSGSYSTTTDTTLTIGGVSDTFSVTTKDKPSGKDDGGGGGGCFIATAAFGSPLAEQVEILRQFRDRHLLTNTAGKKFVAWYYRNGPMAAKFIQDKPLAKMLVRVALYPLIGFSLLLISGYLPVMTVLLLLSALVYLRLRTNKSGVIEDAKL